MTQYVAFLRGINVGGRTIKMADLQACLKRAGFENVSTVLQTGNVLFGSGEPNPKKLKQTIEALLSKTFGFDAKVQVLTIPALVKVIKSYPFTVNGTDAHRYVIFVENGLEKELAKVANGLDANVEAIKAGEGVLYWRVRKGSTLDSVFGKHFTKNTAKDSATNRNMNTLEKIVAKSQQ